MPLKSFFVSLLQCSAPGCDVFTGTNEFSTKLVHTNYTTIISWPIFVVGARLALSAFFSNLLQCSAPGCTVYSGTNEIKPK